MTEISFLYVRKDDSKFTNNLNKNDINAIICCIFFQAFAWNGNTEKKGKIKKICRVCKTIYRIKAILSR